MHRPLITLTTDFGEGSPYVACMKGVICSLAANARIVDITHAVRPQDLRHAAFTLWQTAPCFPEGTLHVVVVDPGVGSDRAILYAEIAGQRFIAPDNGVLSWVARRQPPTLLRAITKAKFWRQPVSATFHGRDVIAPVAAHLVRGADASELGPEVRSMVRLDWPELRSTPNSIEGEVLLIDSFGNLITNIPAAKLENVDHDCARVTIHGDNEMTIVRTYGDVPAESLVALIGSTDLLEIAVTNGNAAKALQADPGAPVTLTW